MALPRKALLAFLTIVTAAGLLAACSDDSDPAKPRTTPSPYLEQTSPENVLANLVTAYERREIAHYSALLYDSAAAGDTSESFVFHFWDEDVEQHRVEHPFWRRADDLASAEAMLADSLVEEVELHLTLTAPYADTTAGHEGQQIILVTDASLNVSTRQPGSEEGIIYYFDANLARFRFKVQSVDAHGDSLWRIVNWEDLGRGYRTSRHVQQTTWGTLKSMWRW